MYGGKGAGSPAKTRSYADQLRYRTGRRMRWLRNGFADKTPMGRVREGSRVGWPSISGAFQIDDRGHRSTEHVMDCHVFKPVNVLILLGYCARFVQWVTAWVTITASRKVQAALSLGASDTDHRCPSRWHGRLPALSWAGGFHHHQQRAQPRWFVLMS